MGLDLAGSYGAGGAADALAQLFKQRAMAAQLIEAQRAHQADEANRQKQLEDSAAWRQMQADENQRTHQANEAIREGTEAEHLANTIPPGFLSATDPGAALMQKRGYGSLLTPQPAQESVGAGFVGPLQETQTRGPAHPAGFLKTASAKQQQPAKPTAEEDTRRYLDIQQKQQLGQPVTPEDTAYAKAYEKTKTLGPTASFNLNEGQRNDARLDRSYNARATELTNLRKPLADQADKLNGLAEVVGQSTPEADALVAPKLLSSIVGGQGSGLRMNQAEINQVVGGRSAWENLKAAVQHWSTDPKTANSITPEQRQQIRALMEAYQKHVGARLKMVDDANDALVDAGDVTAHRRIVSDLKTRLDTGATAASTKKQIRYDMNGNPLP